MKKGPGLPWLFRGFVGDQKLPSYVGIILNQSKSKYVSCSNVSLHILYVCILCMYVRRCVGRYVGR